MAHMDIFNADAFQTMELTAAVNKRPHLPSFLEWKVLKEGPVNA